MTSCDVIVIGAGHNGMAAATMLAKAGRRVLVLEAADTVGGMGRGAQIAPGFDASPVAHLLTHLGPDVIKALDLQRHGLRIDPADTLCLAPDADPLTLRGAYGELTEGLSAKDAPAWATLRKRLLLQAGLLGRFLSTTPPTPDARDLGLKATAARALLDLRRAGKPELREFLRMALINVADAADEELADARLKGLLGFDATLGVALGPRSPTSLLGLYNRLSVGSGGMSVPHGGMDNVMRAFHGAASAAGATIRTATPVARIAIQQARVTGVETATGEHINAPLVLSALSPVTTFNSLVGPRHLDTGFARDIRAIRSKGNVSKLLLALDCRPAFPGLTDAATRIVFAPSTDHVERNFNPSKYGELPTDPCLEIVIPAATDPSAPQGGAMVSVAIQNTAYDLKSGWDKGRAQAQARVMATLERLSPGIGKTVIASDFLSPQDIETRCNVPGGHWHHGEWQVDRLFLNRPAFGAAGYRAPIDGLYVCGAGTHPGGGISGITGLNAAREMAREPR